GLRPAVRVRVATERTPDFVRRYPALLTGPLPAAPLGGWEVTFDRFGVPFAWTPLPASELAGYDRLEARVVWQDGEELDSCRCKDLVTTRRGQNLPDKDLQTGLQLLFGIRR